MVRIFISFAIEDESQRNLLVGQNKNSSTSIEFTDYSVREKWDNAWKTNCHKRILQCAGMIGLITNNTPMATGQLWELECGFREKLPVLLMYGYSDPKKRPTVIPEVIKGKRIYIWNTENITNFINRL